MLEARMIHSLLNPFDTKHEINRFEALAPGGIDLFDVLEEQSKKNLPESFSR
jgi:hypothetical protein